MFSCALAVFRCKRLFSIELSLNSEVDEHRELEDSPNADQLALTGHECGKPEFGERGYPSVEN